MAASKQDSNRTGLAIAEEASLKVLPGVNGADAVWFTQEPNEYSDFGSELTLVARSPINPSRQNQKGGVVDLDASGGFNQDFTQTNMQRLLQGFVFADAHEKAKSLPLAVAANPLTGIATNAVTFTRPLSVAVPVGALALFKGFASPLNAGVKAVTTGGTNGLVFSTLADDAAPVGSVEVCGQQFASGDVALTFGAGIPALTATVFNLTTLGLIPGEWIFIGGDGAAFNFGTAATGYARVKSIAADGKSIVFDKVTWANFGAVAGTGKTIRIFFGTAVRNEKQPILIKRRTYSVERTLGYDDDGQQAEYLDGAVPNELTINIPQADKLNADLTFVALDNAQRTGLEGLRAGIRRAALGEALYNTSSNVFRMRMSIIDESNPNPNPFFAYITEGTVAISNGVTPDKAVGVLGAFDTSAGNFEVSGDVTAYFSTIGAVKAIRQNADVSIDFIFAANNAGFVIDIPLLALGGGRLEVAAGESIKLPLEMSAAENKLGYTLMLCFFPYLPAVAIPA